MAYQKLLLPTDFSPHGSAALPLALKFAEAFGSELHLLHVLETHFTTQVPLFGMGLALPQYVEESRKHAEKAMAEFLSSHDTGRVKVIPAIVQGTPYLEIVRQASDQHIDLILLSTHGRSGVSHMLLGSVAEKVIRKAPCPVLTVRPRDHGVSVP